MPEVAALAAMPTLAKRALSSFCSILSRPQHPLPYRSLFFCKTATPCTRPRPHTSFSYSTSAAPMDPRPSSSVILISPRNEVLLLQRTASTTFANAFVFPGGNLDPLHDGAVPAPGDPERHCDGPAYRLAAIRETFEETGILLARDAGGALLELPLEMRDVARRRVHGSQVSFGDWLSEVGGVADTDALVPFTRWLTPTNVKKRFTTQMYLYMLPISKAGSVPSEMHIPTPDNGVEHISAKFVTPQEFLARSRAGEITLMPPQAFILQILSRFFTGSPFSPADGTLSPHEAPLLYAAQRRELLEFVNAVPAADTPKGMEHPTAQIPWGEKFISPYNLFFRESDKRAVLGLDKPGPELKGSGRGGVWEWVALVRFTKMGAREVEIRLREDVLEEERKLKESRL